MQPLSGQLQKNLPLTRQTALRGLRHVDDRKENTHSQKRLAVLLDVARHALKRRPAIR
jgi:hypothetical protein